MLTVSNHLLLHMPRGVLQERSHHDFPSDDVEADQACIFSRQGWPGLHTLTNTVGDPKQHCYESSVPWRVAEESLQDCSAHSGIMVLILEQRYSAQWERQWRSPALTLIVASFTTVAGSTAVLLWWESLCVNVAAPSRCVDMNGQKVF